MSRPAVVKNKAQKDEVIYTMTVFLLWISYSLPFYHSRHNTSYPLYFCFGFLWPPQEPTLHFILLLFLKFCIPVVHDIFLEGLLSGNKMQIIKVQPWWMGAVIQWVKYLDNNYYHKLWHILDNQTFYNKIQQFLSFTLEAELLFWLKEWCISDFSYFLSSSTRLHIL